MALIYLFYPNDLSPFFRVLIILWLMHTLTFVFSLVIRKKKLKKTLKIQETNAEENKRFIIINRLVNILCLLFAFYLIVIRYILRWQLRVDLIYIYILYFLFFAFLDFAFNVYGVKIDQPTDKALARRRNVIFMRKRNIYLYLRVIYLFLGWVAFMFLPGVFVTGYLLLTPDSGFHIKISESWPPGTKQEDLEENIIQKYQKYIRFDEYYNLPDFPFFRYHPLAIQNYSYKNGVILSLNSERHTATIYIKKCFLFKKLNNIVHSQPEWHSPKPLLIGIDSFYQWDDCENPTIENIHDTLYGGVLIYKPKNNLAYEYTPEYNYVISEKKLIKNKK